MLSKHIALAASESLALLKSNLHISCTYFFFFLKKTTVCMYTSCVTGAHGSEERLLDHLELELPGRLGANMWVLGIKPRTSPRVVSVLNH